MVARARAVAPSLAAASASSNRSVDTADLRKRNAKLSQLKYYRIGTFAFRLNVDYRLWQVLNRFSPFCLTALLKKIRSAGFRTALRPPQGSPKASTEFRGAGAQTDPRKASSRQGSLRGLWRNGAILKVSTSANLENPVGRRG